SRHRSQRSAALADLARRSLAQASDELAVPQTAAIDESWPWKRLRSMSIGPFRGFRESVQFDLKNRVLLFYGPNGSGKTSFCEGLEYGLLGAVEEADTKRIDGRTYLANLHARRYETPSLNAIDHQD